MERCSCGSEAIVQLKLSLESATDEGRELLAEVFEDGFSLTLAFCRPCGVAAIEDAMDIYAAGGAEEPGATTH